MDINKLIEQEASDYPNRTVSLLQGGPVLPALSEIQRNTHLTQHDQFRPLYSVPKSIPQAPPGTNGSPPHVIKRQASQTPLPEESPAKKQSKWTPEEDNLVIKLRGQGTKWDEIAKHLPGRSSISCRLRYQNYLEKRAVWDEEKKDKLARLYARFKKEIWLKISNEMGIPWRSAESMHWQLGEQEMNARANTPVFQLHSSATGLGSPPQALVALAPHGFTPTNAAEMIPNAHPQGPPQHHQSHPPPPPAQVVSTGPTTSYHQRTDSNSSHGGRRRNSSLSRRRADPRSRSSVPLQLGPPLPQIQAASEADLVSGAKTAPDSYSMLKRDGEMATPIEAYGKRRRDEEAASAYRAEADARSQEGRSPDQLSQRSGIGRVKSVKRELDESIAHSQWQGGEHGRLAVPCRV